LDQVKAERFFSWCGRFGWSDRPDDSSRSRDIELDPRYVDTIILRWQEFSGGTATLDGDGGSDEEIAAGREAAAA
jgi:hypothetical protein